MENSPTCQLTLWLSQTVQYLKVSIEESWKWIHDEARQLRAIGAVLLPTVNGKLSWHTSIDLAFPSKPV